MENSDYIERYFHKELSENEKKEFENKIKTDKDFAEEVAFYYSVLQAAKNELNLEKKDRFREIYTQGDSSRAPASVRRIGLRIAAAAAVIGIILGTYFLFYAKSVSSRQLADTYIMENLRDLHVMMGASPDLKQSAIALYNEGKFGESLHSFEKILASDTADFDAVQYAGIAALQLKNFDTALKYFTRLRSYSLRVNPGVFYSAVTLMERDLPGDASQAKQLLLEVEQKGLDGKEKAQEWLKNWPSP